MVMKKARRNSYVSPGSPLVSDDDGLDIHFNPNNAPDINIEHLSDKEPESIPDPSEESDSSSDGEANPVGDIPMRWYDGYDHIGYNLSGEKILPANRPSALDQAADPSSWRKLYDEKNDVQIILTHEELREIARIRAGRYPGGDADTTDELVNWSGPVVQHPLTSGPDPKRRFLPSRHEARLIVKLVRGMRAGIIRRPSEQHTAEDTPYQYDVWDGHDPKSREDMTKSERARDIMRLMAPKPPLPTHGESYNPPSEYLPSKEEEEKWLALDPEERATSYLPTRHASLRHVPLYGDFIKERFERCLDLYLAVRVVKDQQKINPEDLIPDLPSPKDLRPFPTDVVARFGPLPSRARSIDVHSKGEWLLSGSDDGCVRLWDIASGHLQKTWNLGRMVDKIDGLVPPITAVSWCPKEEVYVFAASVGKEIIVVGAALAMGIGTEETDLAMESVKENSLDEKVIEAMQEAGIVWKELNRENEEGEMVYKKKIDTFVENGNGLQQEKTQNEEPVEQEMNVPHDVKCPTIIISHSRPIRTFCWHRKGDYIGCVGRDGNGGIIAIHRLTHRSSNMPFKKKAALVQSVKFHPTRPFFLVATMHHVRVYNLALQQMVKNLKPGVSWISSIDVHSSGDHVLVTSYDKKLCWFDLDLSTRPYKTVRNHDKAIRTARYHPRLPLFADASDDGSCQVFHGTVYDDLNKNALIVPLTKLQGCSKIVDSLGVLDVAWHPRLPWLFTSGADGSINLLTDCSHS